MKVVVPTQTVGKGGGMGFGSKSQLLAYRQTAVGAMSLIDEGAILYHHLGMISTRQGSRLL
jgi:hypothetical protein